MYVTSLPNVTIYEEDMMKIKILFFPHHRGEGRGKGEERVGISIDNNIIVFKSCSV